MAPHYTAYGTYLLIPMDDVAWVHIFCGLTELIHDISFVNILQYVASFDHIVQVSVWNKIHKTNWLPV